MKQLEAILTDMNKGDRNDLLKIKLVRQARRSLIKKQSIKLILETIQVISKCDSISDEQISIRGQLLEEVEERKGGKYVDKLMDKLGM